MSPSLDGRRILVAEDEYLVALDLARHLEALGATVIGPVGRVGQALALATGPTPPDGAILDINLAGTFVYEVADALRARGIPFVFATGYDRLALPPRFEGVARCEKPVDPSAIAKALSAAVALG